MKTQNEYDEIDTVIDILNKFQTVRHSLDVPFFTFDEIFAHFESHEVALMKKMYPDRSDGAVTNNLQKHKYVTPGQDDHSREFVRVHKDIHSAFMRMNEALQKDMSYKLYILSGYRSPAYQMLVYMRELYNADFDMAAAQRIAKLPLDSEHGRYPYHAIDICERGLSDLTHEKEISTSFEKTDAYHWLTMHGVEYGFVLSYPENNQKDTMFEPWHWLYSPRD